MNKLCLLALCALAPLTSPVAAESPEDWYAEGETALAQAIALAPNTAKARNVILFVGDGMGISTVTATRIHAGQLQGKPGEEHRLAWDQLPYVALSKTYNTNLQTPDSAGTMSAMMTGIKTGFSVISVNQNTRLGDCASSRGNEAPTLLQQAQKQGLATGIVSTARLTHATPAATYAHSADRDWESDADLPASAKADGCTDIASQMTKANLDLMLGGGLRSFVPVDQGGKRTDGRNLVMEWLESSGGNYVKTASELDAAAADAPLLGLFSSSHMSYDADRPASEPSLAHMTRQAIQRLQHNPNGFFLMVEAGRIDHAHHAGNAARALADGVALDQAVAAALALVDLKETLVIVTADHSHVFTMGGYSVRGNPILGKVTTPGLKGPELALAKDGKPYTTLAYANGPGFGTSMDIRERESATPLAGRHLQPKLDTTHKNYYQEALVPLSSETHGGEDVAIFAGGPWAHLFHGTHEQHYIYHVMRHALALPAKRAD